MNNYIEAQAKVLAKKEDKYVIGFECPDCEDGYIKTDFKCEKELKENDLIDVKISKIEMVDGKITTISLTEPKLTYMPYIVDMARGTSAFEEIFTEWSDGYIKSLPDEAFADKERNYPIKDKEGNLNIERFKHALDDLGGEKLEEIAKEHGINQYKVTEKLQSKLFRLHDQYNDKNYVGYTEKELEVDTYADKSDVDRLAEEHDLDDFTLIHHWWNNGEYEHWDLFFEGGQAHFVLSKNPLKETSIKSAQREPYSENFWLRGEEIEEIEPNQPGNPSKSMVCNVERIDSGKLALYEAAPQGDGSLLVRLEFFGDKIEGRWSFTSTVPGIWSALKETIKLAEQTPMPILLSGDIGEWEEVEDGLIINGTALSFGVWNGFYWSPEVIQNSPIDDFDGLIVDVEHDNSKPVGAVIEKSVDGPDINVKFKITDYETIERIKNGEYKGLSIDATVFADPQRRMIDGVKQYKRLTVCANPACKLCYFQ